MPPRYPRPSTPKPTLVPPDDEHLVARVTRHAKPWQVILGIALAIFGAGGAFAVWKADLATHRDLAREHDAAAGPVVSLQAEAQALRDRVSRMEAAYVDMSKTLDETRHGVQFLTEQLIEIAKSTHARQVPPPSIDSQGGP